MMNEPAVDDFDEDFEDNIVEDDETETDDLDDQDVDVDSDSDNVGDPSVEINVEDLIRELESDSLVDRLGNEKCARKRLEELMERKRAMRELEDFDDYDI